MAAPQASSVIPTLSAIQASAAQASSALAPLLSALKADPASLDHSAGLSLLSLRPQLLLTYTHLYSLLLASHLHLASSATTTLPEATWSVLDDFTAPRPAAGRAHAGEPQLVEELVAVREVMERVKVMEAKVQKQVDRLVKGAVDNDGKDLANDPMSFRPNPSALVKPSARDGSPSHSSDDDQPEASTSGGTSGALYRPPRLAAVPYSDLPKSARAKGKQAAKDAGKTSTLLKDYALSAISALPHQESVSGLPSLSSSARAARGKQSLAQEQEAYEESSFVRLPLKKAELKRREREERDDAYGIGGGSITGWDDVLGGLSSVGGYGSGRAAGGERESAWDRRKRGADEGAGARPAKAKKGRFERDVGKAARRGGKK